MATTTGTVNFNPDFGEIIEEAYERAGLEMKSGYDLRTARRSLNLLSLEWVNRGINLWAVDQQILPLVAGQNSYSLAADTVDVLDGAIRAGTGASQFDLVIKRASYTSYLQLPDKNMQGSPIQFTVMRGDPPTVMFWPAPGSGTPYSFVFYRMRRMQDAGSVDQTADAPARIIPALISGLAYMLAVKSTQDAVAARVPMLKQMYDEQFEYAISEDRDRTTLRLVPGGYR